MIQIVRRSVQYPYHPCDAVHANPLAILDDRSADAGPNNRRDAVLAGDGCTMA
jgi:hypothetical protein